MTISGTDRSGWLRIAVALAIALLAIGVEVALLADHAGAEGKHANKGKGGAKAGTFTFKGKDPAQDGSGELSEVKVKFNARGNPVKVLRAQATALGVCETTIGGHMPTLLGAGYPKPIAVKAKKVKKKTVRSFKQRLSFTFPDGGTGSGTIGGTFKPDGKKLKLAFNYTTVHDISGESEEKNLYTCKVKTKFIVKR